MLQVHGLRPADVQKDTSIDSDKRDNNNNNDHIIIIITLFKSQGYLAKLECSTDWGDYRSTEIRRGFARQPCCMAGTMKMFCIRKNIYSHRKKNLLLLPCNMAAVQNLY